MPACGEDSKLNLPPVEERVTEAVTNLRNELTSPEDGWRLQYQPTDNSGEFFILLKFNEDGSVRVQSDVAENEGEFFDHTITWRVDNALGLELILDTYGVFHFLFEQDNSTFGAEFEFIYQTKIENNLFFESKSDFSNPTILEFVPAGSSDANQFSREIATNLNEFATISPKALETPQPKQQLILEEENISIFWSLDPAKRIIRSSLAGVGTSIDEIVDEATTLNHSSGYTLSNGRLVLLEPLSFVLKNRLYEISSIAFSEFSNTGPALCVLEQDNGPEYKGQIAGIGNVTMIGSLFDLEGTAFLPQEDIPYSVNSFFIFDENEQSLSDPGGIIAEKFPDASGFIFYYGFTADTTQPEYAVGFILDDDGESEIFAREFEPTTTIGNRIEVILKDSYYHSETSTPEEEADLAEITDLLFEGGFVYASDFPVEGLAVFKLFNPCNQHEMFLVQ